jgi:hypothetical protein
MSRKIANGALYLYIEALTDAVAGDYCVGPVEAYKKIKRALDVALQYKYADLTENCKRVFIEYERTNSNIYLTKARKSTILK